METEYPDGLNPLQVAILNNCDEAVKVLVFYDFKPSPDGVTPLFTAVQVNSTLSDEAVRLLCEKYANMQTKQPLLGMNARVSAL